MTIRSARGFTLVELLVVVGIIAVLISLLMPSLNKARVAAVRTQCLSNVRQFAVAQANYAAEQRNRLVIAGDGSEQGSWIGLLQPYTRAALVRRCPADQSPAFDDAAVPRRITSYGINNYVSPTHAPGAHPPTKITQIPRSSRVVQFAELAETGAYATADHLHVQDFFLVVAPQPAVTLGLIQQQMPLGRHGGRARSWAATLNYSFIDGHAESLRLDEVYTNPGRNRFDPAAAN